jgi:alanine dehydrogenase
MKIGVPKETKRDEGRVALRPDHVSELVAMGHSVSVEETAGLKAGFADSDYEQAGARIVSQEELYKRSELILKVKCPLPTECAFYGPEHVLFTYLHFDENIAPANIRHIVDTGVTGIAYEWVDRDRRLPLLEPMSELTGAAFARKAMNLLVEHKGMLGGSYLRHWPRAKTMVVGAGHIGCNAINVFAMNRFGIVVVDKHPETLNRRLAQYVSPEVMSHCQIDVVRFDEGDPDKSTAALRQHLPSADIVILAAVRRATLPKEKCEYLIRREDLGQMTTNSILCDATACDKDLAETCVSSDSLTETYVENGVIHYNPDHIPSLVPVTATRLLTDATFPYIKLLSAGFHQAIEKDLGLRKAVMCHRGKLTHEYSAKKKRLEYTPLTSLL